MSRIVKLCLGLSAFAVLVGCSTTPTKTEEASKPDTYEDAKTSSSGPTAFPQIDCSRPERTLMEISKWQEANLQALSQLRDPERIENDVRLTSAGLLPDDLPHISVDRECWAEFYTAFSGSLRTSKSSINSDEIRQAADAWITCVEAKNPGLLDDATKIRACFP